MAGGTDRVAGGDPRSLLRLARRATALVGVVSLGLIACQPPPPPDGRDLGVSLDAPTADLAPEEQVTITGTVMNHGTSASLATRVVYVYIGPATVRIDAMSAPGATPCSVTGLLGYCDLASVLPGASLTVTVTLTGLAAGPAGTQYLVASSGGTEPTGDPHANVDSHPLTVGTGGRVDLEVNGGASRITPALGTLFTSKTSLRNDGPSAASDVTVSQVIPAGFTIGTATLVGPVGEAGSCSVATQTVTCSTAGNLVAVSGSAVYVWTMEVGLTPNVAAPFTITHQAASPHPRTGPPFGDSTVFTSYVSDPAVPALVFTPVHTGPLAVGQTFTLHAAWVPTRLTFAVADLVNVNVPAGLRLDGIGGTGPDGPFTIPCPVSTGPGSSTCSVVLRSSATFDLTFTALAPVPDPVSFDLYYTATRESWNAEATVEVVP